MSETTSNIDDQELTEFEELVFPIEFFVVDQVPVSLSASPASKERWKATIAGSARMAISPRPWIPGQPVSVTILYFPDGRMRGDIDNIVKPILDALEGIVYRKDNQVERVWAQKFEPGRPAFVADEPSPTLASALDFDPPVLYVRIDDDSSSG